MAHADSQLIDEAAYGQVLNLRADCNAALLILLLRFYVDKIPSTFGTFPTYSTVLRASAEMRGQQPAGIHIVARWYQS